MLPGPQRSIRPEPSDIRFPESAALSVTLNDMPTKRKRHMITETAEVEAALEPLRVRGIPVGLSELVIKGAEAKTAEVRANEADDARRRALRTRFEERTRSGTGLDVEIGPGTRERTWLGER